MKSKVKKDNSSRNLIIVDGHNFIFNSINARGKSITGNIDYLKEKLIIDLAWYKNFENCDAVVVFDARSSNNMQRGNQIVDGVRIIHSKKNETADDVIEELAAMKTGYKRIFVVTSDYLQQKVIFKKNVYRKSSREFKHELKDIKRKIREEISIYRKKSSRRFSSLEKKLDGISRKRFSEIRRRWD